MTTTISERKLTIAECNKASCGQIACGRSYPQHSGSQRLVRVQAGKFAECQGCGTFFAPVQVRALIAAR
jgi:hypothetical protein